MKGFQREIHHEHIRRELWLRANRKNLQSPRWITSWYLQADIGSRCHVQVLGIVSKKVWSWRIGFCVKPSSTPWFLSVKVRIHVSLIEYRSNTHCNAGYSFSNASWLLYVLFWTSLFCAKHSLAIPKLGYLKLSPIVSSRKIVWYVQVGSVLAHCSMQLWSASFTTLSHEHIRSIFALRAAILLEKRNLISTGVR